MMRPANCQRNGNFSRHSFVAFQSLFAVLILPISASAANLTFNIEFIAYSDPLPPGSSGFTYGDVWAENGFAYVGSDRDGGGISVFSISNAGIPTYLAEYEGKLDSNTLNDPVGTPAFEGEQMEDVEVYDGIGYFGSDVSTSSGTGVDIVDLAIPFEPNYLSRVNGSLCSAAGCGHNKVHTLSVSEGYLYTADNATDTIKVVDVSQPNLPVVVKSLDISVEQAKYPGLPLLPSAVASHEVVVRNDRLYVASKSGSTSTDGWVHIFDVSNPADPKLMKGFLSGARTHTAMPTDDGTRLIVAEERSNGNVKIYDISMINEENDQDDVGNPLATLNTSNVCHNGTCISAFSPHHVHVHGNLLFLPWYEAGLQVFNISNPNIPPVYVGAFDFDTIPGAPPGGTASFSGNWGVDLSLGLSRVLISDRQRGLIVVDATGVVAPGDYDQDLLVDDEDYVAWAKSFGSTRSGQHDAPLGDGNYNGVVDAADYVLWRRNLGMTGPGAGSASAALPEPASMLFLAAGVGLLLVCREVRVS